MENKLPLTASLTHLLAAFNYPPSALMTPVGQGLINKTFLLTADGKETLLLQQLNTAVFHEPLDLQLNYTAIETFLKEKGFFIPALVRTRTGDLLWRNREREVWRAFEYVPNSFSYDLIATEQQAGEVATCFGRFAAVLDGFPAGELRTILPRFHDPEWRYQQMETALAATTHPIEGELKQLLEGLQERKALVAVFQRFTNRNHFPLRVMHHDCKISNILFDGKSGDIICPVDLDTVMPGLFFSDLGDMVRTMCCTTHENNTDWTGIAIDETYYDAVMDAYLSATNDFFTTAEKDHLPFAGLFLIYMQALRFMSDHLNGNVYYKVEYPEQNLHRAKNQVLLLISLENLLRKKGLLLPY